MSLYEQNYDRVMTIGSIMNRMAVRVNRNTRKVMEGKQQAWRNMWRDLSVGILSAANVELRA